MICINKCFHSLDTHLSRLSISFVDYQSKFQQNSQFSCLNPSVGWVSIHFHIKYNPSCTGIAYYSIPNSVYERIYHKNDSRELLCICTDIQPRYILGHRDIYFFLDPSIRLGQIGIEIYRVFHIVIPQKSDLLGRYILQLHPKFVHFRTSHTDFRSIQYLEDKDIENIHYSRIAHLNKNFEAYKFLDYNKSPLDKCHSLHSLIHSMLLVDYTVVKKACKYCFTSNSQLGSLWLKHKSCHSISCPEGKYPENKHIFLHHDIPKADN